MKFFEDNILIRGKPPSSEAYIFFKIKAQNDEEIDKLARGCLHKLKNILQIYGLVTDSYVEVPSGWLEAKISPENPFGKIIRSISISSERIYDDRTRNKNIPLIEKTMNKYNSTKRVFSDKKQTFLKNATDYYNRALTKDYRLEEKLIDLMISLESLFSKDVAELTYRLSLRVTFFLGVDNEETQPVFFNKIKELYKTRSQIIHGTENVKLDFNEIVWLQKIVGESIKRFIHIEIPKEMLSKKQSEKPKDVILRLIDESIYDKKQRKKLSILLKNAIQKW